jgi:hypothetical protein
MAGGMAREASGLPKKGYDMAMEERDDKLELGVVADPEVWTETEAGSRLLEVLALRRFLLLELLLRLFPELLVLVVGVAADSGVMNLSSVPAGGRDLPLDGVEVLAG